MEMGGEALRLSVSLGVGEDGGELVVDLADAPHLLVAGMTGSGKSSVINSIITQLITSYSDEDVAFIFIDPKRVELAAYKSIKHAYSPPAYTIEDTVSLLAWAADEMEHRYALMEKYGHRDIDARNARNDTHIPHCIIVIDELANAMLSDRAHVEPILVKLASMGRAAGMHLVLATQRPSADVVTGLIKANVPARVCMSVMNAMESRIILDEGGAENLTQPGEMLVRVPGDRTLRYAKAPYVDDTQVRKAVREAA
jgi:S-DNA-T family DNA segregation ATPase FtsK/SpoIIIE